MSFLPRLRDGRYGRARRHSEAMPLDSRSFDEGDDRTLAQDTMPEPPRGWQASSTELRQGLDVSDVPLDTLPDELISGFNKR